MMSYLTHNEREREREMKRTKQNRMTARQNKEEEKQNSKLASCLIRVRMAEHMDSTLPTT
jgi:hypothetical protein